MHRHIRIRRLKHYSLDPAEVSLILELINSARQHGMLPGTLSLAARLEAKLR